VSRRTQLLDIFCSALVMSIAFFHHVAMCACQNFFRQCMLMYTHSTHAHAPELSVCINPHPIVRYNNLYPASHAVCRPSRTLSIHMCASAGVRGHAVSIVTPCAFDPALNGCVQCAHACLHGTVCVSVCATIQRHDRYLQIDLTRSLT